MAPPPLPGVLGNLAPILDHWGYLAVGGLLFVEDFGVPVPGETVLIAAAVYAGTGQLNIVAVVLIALVAAVAGDNVGYAIGRYGGHRLVNRYGKYVLLTPPRVAKAEAFFERHGGKIVTIARFVDGLRQANGIIAGMSGMSWPRFLAFNSLGAALWVGVWSVLGYFAGQHVDTIYPAIERYELYFLAALVAVVAFFVVRHLRRRRRDGSDDETDDKPDEETDGETNDETQDKTQDKS
ncbi:alkaline phosphatase [Streptomyces sp. AcH 505]|uniref:DedA family protein n=1 Tax=unclassified Streptomyces TaxID=2593676 RepID=UPI000592019C|nr:DedA family protein [Streptomyces sp. NBC_00370]KIF66498.1 alkaline phosphatase [Streptomyces sp. AcH 505]